MNKIDIVRNFLKAMDSVNFGEASKYLDDKISFDYKELNGIEGDLTKEDLLKTFIVLNGFEKLSHEIIDPIVDANTVRAEANVIHTLGEVDAILTGTYVAKVNENNKIYSWAIEKPNLTNPQLFKQAMEIVIAKMGSK